jgi:dihydropteroate synthase-like protein
MMAEGTCQNESLLFVTGRLAEHALRSMLDTMATADAVTHHVRVLPISVAALMSPRWILKHIEVPPGVTRVVIPGYCQGDLSELRQTLGVPVERGPKDLREIPEYLGRGETPAPDLSDYRIEILAEINHAPRLDREEILHRARQYAESGADLIDIGCEPGDPWTAVGDCVRALRDEGYRVSIDSLQIPEIAAAVRAGAELVLSVNASNRDAAADWGCEVVVIPDSLSVLDSFDDTVALLARQGVPMRLDPILEPIGLGLAASLWRYMDVRRRYPHLSMLMGIGNITEMTDADSAGLNVLLLGICQELGVRSVLTTEVINWARTSVRECDLARRLVHYAVRNRVPAKRVMDELVLLRDRKLQPFGLEQLDLFAQQMKDYNVRVFAEQGQLHALRAGRRYADADPFALFEQLMQEAPDRMDASHAFYLGYEFCKASIALTLGKEYRQDESLDWGYLTEAENWHRLKRERGS